MANKMVREVLLLTRERIEKKEEWAWMISAVMVFSVTLIFFSCFWALPVEFLTGNSWKFFFLPPFIATFSILVGYLVTRLTTRRTKKRFNREMGFVLTEMEYRYCEKTRKISHKKWLLEKRLEKLESLQANGVDCSNKIKKVGADLFNEQKKFEKYFKFFLLFQTKVSPYFPERY